MPSYRSFRLAIGAAADGSSFHHVIRHLFLVVFTIQSYTSLGSQFADDRPVCNVRFSPNSKFLATASWSGTAKIWDVPGCRMLDELKGHEGERLGSVVWHPQATLSQSPESLNLATSGADFNIQLWNLSG